MKNGPRASELGSSKTGDEPLVVGGRVWIENNWGRVKVVSCYVTVY